MIQNPFENIRRELAKSGESVSRAHETLGGAALAFTDVKAALDSIGSAQEPMVKAVNEAAEAHEQVANAQRLLKIAEHAIEAYRAQAAVKAEEIERYQAQLQHILDQMGEGGWANNIDDIFDTGGERVVCTTADGKLIKVPWGIDPQNEERIQNASEALDRAHGEPMFEQKVYYVKDEEGHSAIVTERVEGTTMERMSEDDKNAIPPAHFGALVGGFQKAEELGLLVDQSPSNLIYNPDNPNGFTIIDYVTEDLPEAQRQGIKASTADEVLDCATKVIVPGDEVAPGTALPGHAANYLDAVRGRVDDDLANEVVNKWTDLGYAPPNP